MSWRGCFLIGDPILLTGVCNSVRRNVQLGRPMEALGVSVIGCLGIYEFTMLRLLIWLTKRALR